ncbi:MAG: DUF1232 domain-containing protein [Duncaniella sp.]|nr:DUF1232 domain-containing protein [Duncaniella sp.]
MGLFDDIKKRVNGASDREVVTYFNDHIKRYADVYSSSSLLEKIGQFAKKAGIGFIYKVLLLYCGLIDEDVPSSEKLLAIAALGYFISPLDVVPDFIPGGLVDDGAILAFALKPIYSSLSSKTKKDAVAMLHQWFGDFNEADLPQI